MYDTGMLPLVVVPGKGTVVALLPNFFRGFSPLPIVMLPLICILHVFFDDKAYNDIT